jgi:hypothetical protein
MCKRDCDEESCGDDPEEAPMGEPGFPFWKKLLE